MCEALIMFRLLSIITLLSFLYSCESVPVEEKIFIPEEIEVNSIEDFGKKLEQEINKGNALYLKKHFAIERFFVEISEGLELDRGLLKTVRAQVKHKLDWGDQIIEELGRYGSYRFITTLEDHAGSRIVMRSQVGWNINYHEYLVEENSDEYVITDVFLYNEGRWLSTDRRQKLLEKLRVLDPYNPTVETALHEEHAYRNYLMAVQEGNEALAAQLTNEFPTELLLRPAVEFSSLLKPLLAEGPLPKEKFRYNERGALYLANRCQVYGQLESALLCIEVLDTLLQHDPYLELRRSELYTLLQEHEAANYGINYLAHFDAKEALWGRVFLTMLNDSIVQAIVQLTTLVDEHNISPLEVQFRMARHERLTQSSAYRVWLKNMMRDLPKRPTNTSNDALNLYNQFANALEIGDTAGAIDGCRAMERELSYSKVDVKYSIKKEFNDFVESAAFERYFNEVSY